MPFRGVPQHLKQPVLQATTADPGPIGSTARTTQLLAAPIRCGGGGALVGALPLVFVRDPPPKRPVAQGHKIIRSRSETPPLCFPSRDATTTARPPARPPADADEVPDHEQGGAGVTAPPHVPASYGTYNPPVVSGGAGAKGSPGASASNPSAGGATVIAMPPPPPSTASQQAEAAPAPAVAAPPRPVPASTPAPENQADGGID